MDKVLFTVNIFNSNKNYYYSVRLLGSYTVYFHFSERHINSAAYCAPYEVNQKIIISEGKFPTSWLLVFGSVIHPFSN